ncbi:MAG: hypothetical protein V2I36_00380 [Desulfopila sp.]|jgi:hypothetical protein|nr:hypothetical protein [Desulfopila sp.]
MEKPFNISKDRINLGEGLYLHAFWASTSYDAFVDKTSFCYPSKTAHSIREHNIAIMEVA